ncbi:hypothetical protein GM921_09815 [Pedobacter sp. LMG 31464]|uniref:DUF5977 domain-containing protein n=1 Tax=Pedobacter planticolens TaxID=2679964 RepID=A0A923IVE7_9SPHI|nr:DUF5977 domain-containing protein [Pedobacter planticolens]MBB2145783.1 hypothetical protein [Pedobacter planticolens]
MIKKKSPPTFIKHDGQFPLFLHRVIKWINSFKHAFIFAVLLCPLTIFGQAGFDINKTFPSPDVASLGGFGLAPPSPFTGQVDISIPLYTVGYKELQVPISLSYSTGGHKIEDHPGWVGLGWTLKSGGSVYRKVNGLYDEHPKQTPTGTYTNEIGYLYNCGRVADDFDNSSAIYNYTLNNATPTQLTDNAYDAFPDEFIFNFNGYSGTFFFTRPYHNGPLEIKVKSNGDYKLKAEILTISNSIEFDDWFHTVNQEMTVSSTDRSIYKIKITDDKGVAYIFGGDPNAIEFSNNGDYTFDFYTIANAWHLTEIISPLGYKIQLNYKKAGRVFVQTKQRNVLFYDYSYDFHSNTWILFTSGSGTVQHTNDTEITSISVLSPSYLKSIVTPLQTMEFSSSESTQLNYPLLTSKLNDITDPNYRWGADDSHWQKLDKINIIGLRQIKFQYLSESTRRLQLTGIDITNSIEEERSKYSFIYNPMQLPAYNSKMADHWGYYNGHSYAYDENYLTTRDPNSSYLQAEMLQKITYPTGGYMELEYEPHDYKKIARQFPFTIDLQSANKMAGGLRIKKITASPLYDGVPLVKEYFYIKDYLSDSTSSSGLLAGIPQYTISGVAKSAYYTGNYWGATWGSQVMNYGRMMDNNLLPLSNTNGAHVTYSEVWEKSADGFKVYKYSNHDNGYSDKAPKKIIGNYTSQWHEEGFTSMESFRGLLLSSKDFDLNKNLVKETTYQYAIDTASSHYQVPYFYRNLNYSTGYLLSRVSACLFYTKPALLKSINETLYNVATSSSINNLTETKFYTDKFPFGPLVNDNYQPFEKKTTNSDLSQAIQSYAYANQFSYGSNVYNKMITANMVSLPIENINYLKRVVGDSLITSAVISTYKEFDTLILPHRILQYHPLGFSLSENYLEATIGDANGITFDTKYEEKVKYEKYDPLGNVKSMLVFGTKTSNYLWSYKGQYPIAEIKNVPYAAVENVLGTTAISTFSNRSTASHSDVETFVNPLRLGLDTAFTTSMSYEPLVGMSSQTDPKGLTSFYEYDDQQRLLNIKNKDGNILKNYRYAYFKYANEVQSGTFIKNNCLTGTGSSVYYAIAAGTYYATSVAAANALAQNALTSEGQANANSLGTCTGVYAKITLTNIDEQLRKHYADVYVSFFTDAACTIPCTVSNLAVNYRKEGYSASTSALISTINYSATASGTSYLLGEALVIQDNSPGGTPVNYYSFLLNTSSGYTIAY